MLNAKELKVPVLLVLLLQGNGQKITISDLQGTQEEDEVILRVLYYKRQGTHSPASKRGEEPCKVSKISLEWDKLTFDNEEILRRQVEGKQQLLVPHIYHELVFSFTKRWVTFVQRKWLDWLVKDFIGSTCRKTRKLCKQPLQLYQE